MWLVRLFTSFQGRIGRRAYWFGLIVLILISPFSISAVLSADPFQAAIGAIRNFGLIGLLWALGLLIPLAALNTKRLHDLGKSGLIAILFYAPAAVSVISNFTGWQPGGLGDAISWTLALAGVAGAAGAWFLFKLGFYSGTEGPNKYGPDPSS